MSEKMISFEDYIRLTLLLKDLKRGVDAGIITIENEDLKKEFEKDFDYFYQLFDLK